MRLIAISLALVSIYLVGFTLAGIVFGEFNGWVFLIAAITGMLQAHIGRFIEEGYD